MSYTIEQGIPAPSGAAEMKPGRKLLYPFAEMKVGESFLVPETQNVRNRADRVKSAASSYGRRHDVKMTTAVVEGGIRVWRIA